MNGALTEPGSHLPQLRAATPSDHNRQDRRRRPPASDGRGLLLPDPSRRGPDDRVSGRAVTQSDPGLFLETREDSVRHGDRLNRRVGVMQGAGLHDRLRPGAAHDLGRLFSPVADHEEHFPDPSVLQVGQRAHPELGAFPALSDPKPADVLVPGQGDPDRGVNRPAGDAPDPRFTMMASVKTAAGGTVLQVCGV